MKENKYDEELFFNQYRQMLRSTAGLDGAGEWHILKQLMPDFRNKSVLDLGCGFGWHCEYAVAQGAQSVVGIDLSKRMLEEASKRNPSNRITYRCLPIEELDYPDESFDIVISSLAFHYIASFSQICDDVNQVLVGGGTFLFSVEHPIFTAQGREEWALDQAGNPLYWPVDRYFDEGNRIANFLGEDVVKYHRTVTTYVNTLLKKGFEIIELCEPTPDPKFLPQFQDELRRPMFLIIKARKK